MGKQEGNVDEDMGWDTLVRTITRVILKLFVLGPLFRIAFVSARRNVMVRNYITTQEVPSL